MNQAGGQKPVLSLSLDCIGNNSALIQIIVWHRTGSEPLSQPIDLFDWSIMAKFTDKYVRHRAMMRSVELNQWYQFSSPNNCHQSNIIGSEHKQVTQYLNQWWPNFFYITQFFYISVTRPQQVDKQLDSTKIYNFQLQTNSANNVSRKEIKRIFFWPFILLSPIYSAPDDICWGGGGPTTVPTPKLGVVSGYLVISRKGATSDGTQREPGNQQPW